MIYRRSLIALIMLSALMISCGDSGVIPREDATDEIAIKNIIRYDLPSLFNVDLLDFSIPDTVNLNLSPLVIEHFWLEADSSTYHIAMNFTEPEPGDSIGSVTTADVNVGKIFYGSYEIIGADTTGGGSTPVRLSVDARISGRIISRFDRLGFISDRRRGWILTRISDATYNELGLEQGQIDIHSNSYPDHRVDPSLKSVSETITLVPGESLTVTVSYTEPPDFVRFRYPAVNGFVTLPPVRADSALYTAGFRIPGSAAYSHFLVYASWINTYGDSVEVSTSATGVLYRAR